MNERDALLILNAIDGLSGKRLRKLREYFGSALELLRVRAREFTGISPTAEKWLNAIAQFPKEEFLKKEHALLSSRGVSVLVEGDPEYPQRLKEIPDAPIVLYVKGNVGALKDPSVALVGSRRASVYGLGVAERFAADAVQAGLTVVSGLAQGIDTAAHRGALKAKGTTVAVLGNGLAEVFPRSNERLFEEISASGAVVSEFPMTMPPIAWNFPRRNRIISGLSLGVVVVEASFKSGALITADFALEQGRDVFAVPGPIGNPNSNGVHRLIQQGAKLICSMEDVREELSLEAKAKKFSDRTLPERSGSPGKRVEISNESREILDLLNEEPLHVDQLSSRCGFTAAKLTAALFLMELNHLVKQLPGNYFIRQRQLN